MGSRKTALVTGASKGIGKAVAVRLAKEGYDIWLNYRSDGIGANEAKCAVEEAGQSCVPLAFDVADAEACKNALAPLLQECVPDVLVNNAGFTRDSIMAMMPHKDWQAVLDVHLNGFFNVTTCLLPAMLRRRSGRIITMASTSGQTGVGGQVGYSAAKSGLIGATRSLAVEVAKRNILVNAVAPGFIETDMTDALPADVQAGYLDYIPLRRFGSAQDVAEAVSFLASDKAGYITWQVLAVNGGMYC